MATARFFSLSGVGWEPIVEKANATCELAVAPPAPRFPADAVRRPLLVRRSAAVAVAIGALGRSPVRVADHHSTEWQ